MKSKKIIKQVNALLQEYETYENYKKLIRKEIDGIKSLYVSGKRYA